MANEIPEWWKYLGVSGVTAITVWLGKKYDWLRMRPKEAVDVKKTEQEIISFQVSDSQKINETAIAVNTMLLASLKQTEGKVNHIEEALARKELSLASIQGLLADERKGNIELKMLMAESKKEVAEIQNKTHEFITSIVGCDNCEEALNKLKKKFGIV